MTRESADDASVPLPHTWHPRVTAVAAGVAVFLVVAGIGLWVLMPSETRQAFTVPQQLTLLLFLIALLFGLYGVGRTRLSVDERGLTVVNAFRTHRLTWPQVLAVNLRSGDPWAVLDVDDGTAISVMALQTADGRRAREALAQLRNLVETHSRTDRND